MLSRQWWQRCEAAADCSANAWSLTSSGCGHHGCVVRVMLYASDMNFSIGQYGQPVILLRSRCGQRTDGTSGSPAALGVKFT